VTIQRNLLGFFWGRLLLSIFFGISTFIVFIILGAPYPLILAAIAGVFDLIPGIGATLGISLVALILLTQSIWMSVQVIVSCILLQQVEENLLLPHVMQGSLNINPVVMFFALLVGARIAGILGIFLAIPIAGVIVSLFEINEMKARSQTPPSSTSPPDDNSSPDDAVQAKDNQLPNSGQNRLRHMDDRDNIDDRDKINEKNEPRDND
jgi:predicted PurR-regulated permease PerM